MRIFVNIMQIRERNEEGMGRGSKKTDYGGFFVFKQSPLGVKICLRVTASKDRAKLEIDPKIKILKLCQNKAYHTRD